MVFPALVSFIHHIHTHMVQLRKNVRQRNTGDYKEKEGLSTLLPSSFASPVSLVHWKYHNMTRSFLCGQLLMKEEEACRSIHDYGSLFND